MGLVLATTAALSIWLVLWSIDVKAIDAIMLSFLIILIAAMGRIASRFLPGNQYKT